MFRLRQLCRGIPSLVLVMLMFAFVAGQDVFAAGKSTDGSPEIIYSVDEYLDLAEEGQEEEYIPDMEITPGSDEIIADGEETTFSSEFDVSGKEADQILRSEESLTQYLESQTDNIYEVSPDSQGNVQVSAPYQTKRVLVDRILHNSYGASTVYVDREENESILIFDSQKAARNAVKQINKKYGSVAEPDLIATVCSSKKSASSKTSNVSAGTSSVKPLSWGAYYMGLDKLVDGDSEALGSRKVTVAIIDSGFNKSSYLLKGKKISSYSRSFVGGKKKIQDQLGHGCHVTGIVASCTPDNVELMILRVTDARGRAPLSYLKAAFRYAVRKGADVINLSMGVEAEYAWKIKHLNKIINKAYRKGIPIIVSAGNQDESVRHCYPACNGKCITVAALDPKHKQAWYSNYGSAVDFAAPGTGILSSGRTGKTNYVYMDGTSMSAPHITAAAAIIKAMQPSLSAYGVEKELRSLSKDLGAKGKDKKYGYGVPRVGKLYDRGIKYSKYKIVGSLGTQKIKTARNHTKGIDLTWRKCSKAESYILYRKKDNGSWKKLKIVKGASNTSWRDRKAKAGHLYRYKVVTYRLGYKGTESKYRSIYRLKTPKLNVRKAGKRKLRAGWKNSGRVSGYQLKYAVGSTFRNAKKVTVSSKKTSLILKKLKRNTVYSIKVRAYRKRGKVKSWSAWSEIRQIRVR